MKFGENLKKLWKHSPADRVPTAFVTSHAKTFRTVTRFKTDSRSSAVHLPFERTGMPFERLVLSVLKNSSSVRTVRAIRSRKLISRSNGSSYLFEKNHQPFEWLELSVQEIHQPFEWLKLSVREIHQPFEWLELSMQERNNETFLAAVPTKEDLKTNRHALLNDACRLNSHHVSVLCLSSFNFK